MSPHFENIAWFTSVSCLLLCNFGYGDKLWNNCPTWQFFQPFSPRIVGGEIAPRSVPWQAALYYGSKFKCGAIIIDQTTVLTAAHCLNGTFYLDLDPRAYKIAVGITDKSEGLRVGITPESIIRHPLYSVAKQHDIAIFKHPCR